MKKKKFLKVSEIVTLNWKSINGKRECIIGKNLSNEVAIKKKHTRERKMQYKSKRRAVNLPEPLKEHKYEVHFCKPEWEEINKSDENMINLQEDLRKETKNDSLIFLCTTNAALGSAISILKKIGFKYYELVVVITHEEVAQADDESVMDAHELIVIGGRREEYSEKAYKYFVSCLLLENYPEAEVIDQNIKMIPHDFKLMKVLNIS